MIYIRYRQRERKGPPLSYWYGFEDGGLAGGFVMARQNLAVQTLSARDAERIHQFIIEFKPLNPNGVVRVPTWMNVTEVRRSLEISRESACAVVEDGTMIGALLCDVGLCAVVSLLLTHSEDAFHLLIDHCRKRLEQLRVGNVMIWAATDRRVDVLERLGWCVCKDVKVVLERAPK